jgi:CTP-dependent riboflavin kinase
MLILRGTIFNGVGHFRPRIENYPDVFEAATGEKLFPGTLNLRVARAVPPVEHFRVLGAHIGEPMQDLLFEVCRINGIWAYRIRPFDLRTGAGGHGDDVLEIACSRELRPLLGADGVAEVSLFRPEH